MVSSLIYKSDSDQLAINEEGCPGFQGEPNNRRRSAGHCTPTTATRTEALSVNLKISWNGLRGASTNFIVIGKLTQTKVLEFLGVF